MTPSSATRELGIATIHVTDTGGRLTIEGRSADGGRVAGLELAVGTVELTVDEPRTVEGRLMTLSFGATEIRHESEGLAPLSLPSPSDARIARFLADPAVAVALDRWSITVEADPALAADALVLLDEAAYACNSSWGGTPCTTSSFSGCSASQKKKWPHYSDYREFRCCYAESNGVLRECKASGGGGQSTSCGTTGPNGCAVCWTQDADTSCTVTSEGGYCKLTYCNG